MAKRHLSAKQIRAGFGGKRRKASLRSKPKHRRRVAAKSHRKPRRTGKRRTVKRNLGELVIFGAGNPAHRKGKKRMAAHKKRRRASAKRSNAGRPRRHTKAVHHRRRTRNPGMGSIGSPKDWVMGGTGALAGFVGSAAIPQMVLGSGNTGMTGYAVSAGAAIALGFLAHFLLPRQRAVTVGVVSGGFANLLRRIITDQTPYGKFVAGQGMGDYMAANWGPPRLPNALQSAMAEAPGTQWSGGGMITASSGVSGQDMMDVRASRPC